MILGCNSSRSAMAAPHLFFNSSNHMSNHSSNCSLKSSSASPTNAFMSCSYLVGLVWVFEVITIMMVLSWPVYVNSWKKIIFGRGKNPKAWPIMGSQYEASLNFHRLHDWCHSFFTHQHRTVELKFFSTRIYLTVDPANVEHILKTNFRNYPKGEKTREKLNDMLGEGIFNADGDMWRKQRRIANAVFCGRTLKDFSLKSFREDTLHLLEILDAAAKSKQSVNLQELLMGMTMDSISRVGFGIHTGSMSPSLVPAIKTFTKAFDKANEMISTRFVNVWWKTHKFLKVGREKTLMQELRKLNAFTTQIIATRRAEIDLTKQISLDHRSCCANMIKRKEDLLSRLMEIGGGGQSSDKGLRDSILNFVIAGRDTTAVTMSWFIYNLCKKKEVAEKVYQEAKEVMGLHACGEEELYSQSFQEVANRLTYEALANMHYLHAALTETLRLYPAVPRDTKVAIHDDVLPDGTCIKAGDHVAYVPYSMGRMEFLWGSDVLEFKPERWLKDGLFNPTSPFKFTAFQAGPRMCLGKDWAYLQMKMAITLLLYFFEFRLVPNHVVKYRMMMVLGMANGLQVTIHRRGS